MVLIEAVEEACCAETASPSVFRKWSGWEDRGGESGGSAVYFVKVVCLQC